MSHTFPAATLPSAMEKKLTQIARRQVVISLIRAAAISASVLSIGMVVAMSIDWQVTLFSTSARSFLTGTTLILAIGSALFFCRATCRRVDAASNADAEIPQLQERWQTIVSMSTSANQPTSPVAIEMLKEVTSEAVAIGRIVDPRRVADASTLRSTVQWFAVSALGLAGFLAVDWSQTSVLLRRFWSPMTNISATTLRSSTGDITVPRGEFVDLIVEMTGLPRAAANLTIAHERTKPENIELPVDPKRPHMFAHRIQVENTFRYRVRAGDGQTEWQTVSVIDYPRLAEVQFQVISPAYLNRPNVEKSVIPNRVKVMQGALLRLRMRPKEPLQKLELTITPDAEAKGTSTPSQVLSLLPETDGSYRFEMPLMDSLVLSPGLWNSHGLTNEEKSVCRIQVMVDTAPVARILNPTEETAVASDDVIDIKFEGHDDHGIAKAELVIYDESDPEEGKPAPVLKVMPIPLGDQEMSKHVLGMAQLDLKELKLRPGTQISYSVRVTDNRMVNHDPAKMTPENAHSTDANPTSSDSESRQSEPEAKRQNVASGSSRESTEDVTERDQPVTNAPLNVRAKKPGENDEKAAPSAKTSHVDDDASSAKDLPDDSRMIDPASATTSEENGVTSPADAENPNRPSTRRGDSSADESDPENDHGDQNKPVERPLGDQKPAEGRGKASEVKIKNSTKSPDGTSNRRSGNPDDKSPSNDNSPERKAMAPQQSDSGQNAETNRRKLKITQRLTAVAKSRQTRQAETFDIRERVVEIDERLAEVESGLTRVINREIPDSDRTAQFKILDGQLGDIEKKITDLRKKTRDDEFAFVGLQMLDIGRSHVTPARERVFTAVRDTISAGETDSRLALQQIVRARELLAALLTRYERVARDKQLANSLNDGVKMYEVYVEKMQQLMREARQVQNPLERKMAIIEVDQPYLDRYTEVLTMRRDMQAEFGRMLGDDPRLLARYLDLVKRRRSSLRDQLSSLSKQQKDAAIELENWLSADVTQRDELWSLYAELRMQASTPLARDAAELAERVERQLPLILEGTSRTQTKVVELGRKIAETSRRISLEVRRQIRQPDAVVDLRPQAVELAGLFVELDATLEQINFESSKETDVTNYVTGRLLESRTVADQADSWKQIAEHIHHKRYHGLAEVDQHRIAIATALLRSDMAGMDEDLVAQFQQLAKTPPPEEIMALVRELKQLMDHITFEQGSATFALSKDRLAMAQALQKQATEDFARAEEVFDQIRRAVIAALDELDVQNPNIAELQDPRLDEFLTQLEREPNLEAQLGIPERPRNLRVIAESMSSQEQGGDQLQEAEEEASKRSRQEMQVNRKRERSRDKPEESRNPEMTEKDREERQEARQNEDDVAKALASMKEKVEEPSSQPIEIAPLEELAEELKDRLDRMDAENIPQPVLEQLQKNLEAMIASLKQRAAEPATSSGDREKLEQLAAGLKQKFQEIQIKATSDERWKEMQQDIAKTLEALKDKLKDPSIPPADRKKLEQMEKDLKRSLDQMAHEEKDDERWKRVAEFERIKSVLKSIARGERIPDEQWNRLLSTLDDGLWQVGGRKLPEEYRKAIEQYQERIRKLTNTGDE